MDEPKDSRKDDYSINKEGMYGMIFSSQQPKAKNFRRHCCNVLFSHVRQQFTNKMKEDHQQAMEEKDATLPLVNDDLKNREHDNVVLQAQRMCIRTSYKNVKTSLPVLKKVMLLMQRIDPKTTLL